MAETLTAPTPAPAPTRTRWRGRVSAASLVAGQPADVITLSIECAVGSRVETRSGQRPHPTAAAEPAGLIGRRAVVTIESGRVVGVELED